MTTTLTSDGLGAADADDAEPTATVDDDATLVVEELLVEDVSIDGMCGVY
jgi:mycofactocin precursor